MIPKFDYYDVVKTNIDIFNDNSVVEGLIFIIDRNGTFEQNEEVSYDVFVINKNLLIKHVRESQLSFVRKPTKEEINIMETI